MQHYNIPINTSIDVFKIAEEDFQFALKLACLLLCLRIDPSKTTVCTGSNKCECTLSMRTRSKQNGCTYAFYAHLIKTNRSYAYFVYSI